jgi:hypothetical protein
MQMRQLLIFIALIVLAAAAVIATISAFQRSHSQVQVDTPAVKVETRKPDGSISVGAPSAHIENDKDNTKIDAPGVKIEVPKPPAN